MIPPTEWSPMSQFVPNDFMCTNIYEQSRGKLLLGGSEIINTEKDPMSYGEYANMAKEHEDELFDREPEKMFWANQKSNLYSIDNKLSLFGKDVLLWNLNNFTNVHSNIHGTRAEKVSFILKPYIKSFIYMIVCFISTECRGWHSDFVFIHWQCINLFRITCRGWKPQLNKFFTPWES